ncbi:MAG: hypothetical protein JST50_13760 [Bacteroidetes bacterium]|jgi:hypothetical protein|nr:hypothetical protein [Bacteroidota bacterium]
MIQTISTTEFNPCYAGEFITESYYHELVENFNAKFPTEVTSVPISKSVIKAALDGNSVSGIKFMNGLEDSHDPSSRILVLIPGNFTTNNTLPNSIINKSGFLTNNGTAISLERTWEVLFNHVLHYKTLDPDMHYTKINRGSFLGRERLLTLLNDSNCEDFIYHFGYVIEENLPYKPIIQPANGLKMFVEQSIPCPGSALCPDTTSVPCAITYIATSFAGKESENQLSVLRSFRDKLLQNNTSGIAIEKYYTISASLIEAINTRENKEAIFRDIYNKYLKPSVEQLNRNDEASAYLLFTEVIDHLTNEYLFQ